jgi:hypothetical protein
MGKRTDYGGHVTTLQTLSYRDCPRCGVRDVSMRGEWTKAYITSSEFRRRSWAVLSCPRCAGLVVLELELQATAVEPGQPVGPHTQVIVLSQLPTGAEDAYNIGHLPSDVEKFFKAALRVMDAGVPDAAAVQLRRALEAAASHRGMQGRNLVASIQMLIDEGLVTKDFGPVLHHIRKIGNLGAHATDEEITDGEIRQALNFTVQFLRNIFEVPGELAALQGPPDAGTAG